MSVHRPRSPWTLVRQLGKLGLGYRLISGRDAFPARRIGQLKDVWRTRPRALSALVAGVPPQLDALIAQLLSFNPAGRCRTAAEVFVRHNDWLGLPADMDPVARIGSALKAASERHQQLAESEQVESPIDAPRAMAGFISACVAGAGSVTEIELVQQLPPHH